MLRGRCPIEENEQKYCPLEICVPLKLHLGGREGTRKPAKWARLQWITQCGCAGLECCREEDSEQFPLGPDHAAHGAIITAQATAGCGAAAKRRQRAAGRQLGNWSGPEPSRTGYVGQPAAGSALLLRTRFKDGLKEGSICGVLAALSSGVCE